MQILFGLLFLWTPLGLAAGTPGMVTYDLTRTLPKGATEIALRGKAMVSLARQLAPGDRVFFDDLLPGANWGHPARFRVVDKKGNLLQSLDVQRPPQRLAEALRLDVDPNGNGRPGEATFTLQNFSGRHRVADPARFYALLFNGLADRRHRNDFAFLYRVLTQIYGYDRSHIIVADDNHRQTAPDLDDDGSPDIQYGSSAEALKKIVGDLKTKITSEDQLLVVVNDHGENRGGESTLVLADGEMTASQFAGQLNEIKVGRRLSIFEQCFSGGFVRPTVGNGFVSMAAATSLEFSFGTTDQLFNEFLYHVISAFAFQDHKGGSVLADANGDGRVSAKEAFTFAIAKDESPETPFFETAPNTGLATDIGLNF